MWCHQSGQGKEFSSMNDQSRGQHKGGGAANRKGFEGRTGLSLRLLGGTAIDFLQDTWQLIPELHQGMMNRVAGRAVSERSMVDQRRRSRRSQRMASEVVALAAQRSVHSCTKEVKGASKIVTKEETGHVLSKSNEPLSRCLL